MWAAARQCQSQFVTIASTDGIDAFGRLRYTCLMTCHGNAIFIPVFLNGTHGATLTR
jgi:hypothetical protein